MDPFGAVVVTEAFGCCIAGLIIIVVPRDVVRVKWCECLHADGVRLKEDGVCCFQLILKVILKPLLIEIRQSDYVVRTELLTVKTVAEVLEITFLDFESEN